MFSGQDVISRKALLLLALSVNGGINGRKKLQKIIYLTNCIGWNTLTDFRFYHYGPYSDHLLSEIQNLNEAGIIQVDDKIYNGNKHLFLHRLTEKGQTLLTIILERVQDNHLIEQTRKLITKLNGYSSDQLEVMASLYYLQNDLPSITREELTEIFENYKPHFDKSQIKGGFEIFDIMQPYLLSE